MALAAFGQPRFADQVREVLHVMEDGRYSVNVGFFNFLSADANMFTPAFAEKFGSPRDFKKELPFDSISDEYSGRVTCEDQRYADLAASLQVVLEDALLGLARRAKRLTESKNLCFAGGVALNAVANTRLIAESGFEDLFIPTDPGDGGASAGAALLEYRRLCDTPGPRFAASPFLGDEYPDEPLLNLAERLSPADWTPYLLEGCATGEDCTLRWTRFDSLEELAAEAASYLWAGRILGWIQGRFEFGPRALGNRSILVHPGRVDAVRRLSEKVKNRAQFRPYALAIREEDVLDVFDLPAHIPRAARWMQMVKRVRSEVEHLVRGAIHCNRTTRLQICSADDNPAFHCLLTAFREKYGIGALLNTSFNEPSYPIVSSPTEGMLTFARSEMDVLVAGQVMVTKI
jgi:carbamoyltransferase